MIGGVCDRCGKPYVTDKQAVGTAGLCGLCYTGRLAVVAHDRKMAERNNREDRTFRR
jgi:hypothetical protein